MLLYPLASTFSAALPALYILVNHSLFLINYGSFYYIVIFKLILFIYLII